MTVIDPIEAQRRGRLIAEQVLSPLLHPSRRPLPPPDFSHDDLAAITELRDAAALALPLVCRTAQNRVMLAARLEAALHAVSMLLDGEVAP